MTRNFSFIQVEYSTEPKFFKIKATLYLVKKNKSTVVLSGHQ